MSERNLKKYPVTIFFKNGSVTEYKLTRNECLEVSSQIMNDEWTIVIDDEHDDLFRSDAVYLCRKDPMPSEDEEDGEEEGEEDECEGKSSRGECPCAGCRLSDDIVNCLIAIAEEPDSPKKTKDLQRGLSALDNFLHKMRHGQ